MFGNHELSDKELLKTVNSRLTRTGTGSRIVAKINRGVITLSGNLQFAAQRIPIMNAASRVSGVRQVIDQMQFAQKKSYSPPPKVTPKQIAPSLIETPVAQDPSVVLAAVVVSIAESPAPDASMNG
jgi:BON domain